MTKLRVCLYLALLISGAAAASEAAVKQGMLKNYPGMQVESVTRAPIAGLYEVFAGGEIFYAD